MEGSAFTPGPLHQGSRCPTKEAKGWDFDEFTWVHLFLSPRNRANLGHWVSSPWDECGLRVFHTNSEGGYGHDTRKLGSCGLVDLGGHLCVDDQSSAEKTLVGLTPITAGSMFVLDPSKDNVETRWDQGFGSPICHAPNRRDLKGSLSIVTRAPRLMGLGGFVAQSSAHACVSYG